MEGTDRAPGQRRPRDLTHPPDEKSALSFLGRLHRVDLGDRARGRRNASKVPGDHFESRTLVEITDHERRRVIGMVEGVVELLQSLGRDAFDVAAPPDRRMVVRMLSKGGRERLLVEHLERRVLAALELVADDRHLRLPILVPQQRPAHARGLDPHGDLELVGGDRLVVVGAVKPGRRVEASAERFEHRRDRRPPVAVVLRCPLEHQVLEQMSRAGVSDGFVAAPDVIDDRERHHGCDPILEQQEFQAVGAQAELAEARLFLDEVKRRRNRLSAARRADPLWNSDFGPGSHLAPPRHVLGSVDADHIAGDPAGSRSTERHERSGHVLRAGQTSRRMRPPDSLDHLFVSRNLPQCGRVGDSRAKRVDRNAPGRELHGQLPDIGFQGGFRGGDGAIGGPHDVIAGRGHRENPRAGSQQIRKEEVLCPIHERARHDVEGHFELRPNDRLLSGCPEKGLQGAESERVEHDRNAGIRRLRSAPARDRGHDLGAIGVVRRVDVEELGAPARRDDLGRDALGLRKGRLAVEVDAEDVPTRSRQRDGGRLPKAGGRAQDQSPA